MPKEKYECKGMWPVFKSSDFIVHNLFMPLITATFETSAQLSEQQIELNWNDTELENLLARSHSTTTLKRSLQFKVLVGNWTSMMDLLKMASPIVTHGRLFGSILEFHATDRWVWRAVLIFME